MIKSSLTLLLTALSLAQAQSQSNRPDQNLISIQGPTLLGKSQFEAAIVLRAFGGYDKLPHADFWLATGLTDAFELEIAGSFANRGSANPAGGFPIRYGGTDQELSVRYMLPMKFPITINAGLAYIQTPAQGNRLATTLAASTEYSPISKLYLYLNPKAVLLNHNSLVGIGLGASYGLAPKLTLQGDWTPLVTGSNSISTQSEAPSRVQIYSIGLRFSDLVPRGSLDLGVTNGTGLTTGTSLTPSLGNSPAIYVRLSYRF